MVAGLNFEDHFPSSLPPGSIVSPLPLPPPSFLASTPLVESLAALPLHQFLFLTSWSVCRRARSGAVAAVSSPASLASYHRSS
ncbi:hypothetical protein CRG98_001078 [Punica granatum]|uniref:Uncharacterized protein n=1 Tax=Punica granatum TaxID=22663 RepID=A0A2I0LCW9_PUNGR|nr:hypothetical protein CRG98_001078 [Punica granatum]